MKRFALTLAAMIVGLVPLVADTITQTNAQGETVVIQREAIVYKQDSAYIYYKHFDLQDRRIVKVSLSKGSLPYTIHTSTPSERQQIIDTWKQFGYKATLTELSGKIVTIYDAYLDFYPPEGRGSLLESVPPRTNFPVQLASGGADEIEFSKIDQLVFEGSAMSITLADGSVERAKFLPPTDQAVETRILGVTDHYNPASEDVFDYSSPLTKVKEIRFGQ